MNLLALAVAVLLAGIAPLPPVAGDDAGLTPAQVVAAARTRWSRYGLPPYLEYDVDLAAAQHARSFIRELHVAVRTSDHAAIVTEVSASGKAPGGVAPDRQRFFIDESFGLVRTRVAFSTPAPEATATLGVIGHVTALSPSPYDVTSLGEATIGGAAVYHLALRPRSDADRNIVRELWVDESTYDVRRLVARPYEPVGPFRVHYSLVVDYGPVLGTWLITGAHAEGSVHAGLFSYSGAGDATFGNVTAPAAVPGL